MKKVLATILSLALATSAGAVMVACGGDDNPGKTTCTQHVDTNPQDGKCDNCGATITPNNPSKPTLNEAELLKGVWETPQYGDATHALKDYVAFHEGGIFYWRAQGDKNPSAGNYTFALETGNEKVTIEGDDGNYDIDVEAWVTLKTFKGEAVTPAEDAFQDGKYPIAYDADEGQYVLHGIHYRAMRFIHYPDRAHSYADEDSITVASYNVEGSTVNKLELGHNGKYTDMVTDDYYEGSWAYNATTKTYTLTDDEGGGTATVVESANGAFGTYTRGDTVLELNNADFKAEIILKLEGSIAAAGGAAGEVLVYNNNKFDIKVGGNVSDTGTWVKDGDNYVLTGAKISATTTYAEGKYSVVIMGSTLEEVVPAAALLELNGEFVMNADNNINGAVQAVLYDNNTVIITTSCPANPMVPEVVENGTYAAANGAIVITIPVEDGDDKTYTIADTNGVLSFKYAVTMSMGANSVPFSDITVSSESTVAMQLSGELTVNPANGTTATTKVIMYGSLASGGGKVVIVTNLGGTGYILSTVAEIGSWTLNPDYTMTLTIGDKTFTNAPKTGAAQGVYTFDYNVTLAFGENAVPFTITVETIVQA